MSARVRACPLPRDRRGWVILSADDRAVINRFIFGHLLRPAPPPINGHHMPGVSRKQWWDSYQQWAKGGHAWNPMEQGGTGVMAALCWYHHAHRPGSREWRPSIVIAALLDAARAWSAAERAA